MKQYLKVDTDTTLVRDMESNAIVSRDMDEYSKFLRISERKYQEKIKFDNLKSDVDSMKSDIEEIKNLLKSIVRNWIINI